METQMRRCFYYVLLMVGVIPRFGVGAEPAEVNLDYVAERAEQRAEKPFHSPRADLPKVLRDLDYDKYREIEFRHDMAFWSSEDLPFRVEFFHPGYIYQEPVHINEFSATHVQPVRFVQDFFNYRSLKIQKQIPADTGYAGFRLLYHLNETNKWDELGAFLGASYFRLLGKGQSYGLSARGLALDCGGGDRPEEFPIFTDWWLGKPQPDDKSLHLFAILDSVSCAGAFEFLIRPGDTTVVDINAVLYFRRTNEIFAADPQHQLTRTVGLAPLTSMFWFGENSERKWDDYRPEVHDSDGLLVREDNGEILWRPLNNPTDLRHQIFALQSIKGFGLCQRDRKFADYEDIFNFYYRVPSVWIEPHGNWGAGALHLVELSTTFETLDNIVAFWEPNQKPEPLQPYRFGYTLYWTRDMDLSQSPNRVVSTRIGADPRNSQQRQFAIDFDGTRLDTIPENEPPTPISSCSTNGAITQNQVFRNTQDGTWRVILSLAPAPDNKAPIDLRCTLKKGDETVSETWVYHWSPP